MQLIQTPATERADNKISETEGRIKNLESRHTQTQQALADAEKQAVEALVQGGPLDASTATRLRGELQIIGQAIEGAKAKLPGLQIERKRVEAVEARRLSAEKLTEAEKLEEACRKPLAKLAELQGIEYTISILACQPAGRWFAVLGGLGEPAPYLGLNELKPDVVGAEIAVPKSRALRNEAAEFLLRAEKLEAEIRAAQPAEATPPASAEVAGPPTLYGQEQERSLLTGELVGPRKNSFYRGD